MGWQLKGRELRVVAVKIGKRGILNNSGRLEAVISMNCTIFYTHILVPVASLSKCQPDVKLLIIEYRGRVASIQKRVV